MDGEEFDAGRAGGNGVGFGVEFLQALFEDGGVDAEGGGLGFERVEQLEEAARVGELGWSKPGIAAEREPCALDQLGGGEARTLGGCGLEDVPDASDALAGFVRKKMAAFFDEARDGEVFEGGIVGTGEGVQFGEREPAPGRAQNRERGDTVGR